MIICYFPGYGNFQENSNVFTKTLNKLGYKFVQWTTDPLQYYACCYETNEFYGLGLCTCPVLKRLKSIGICRF